MKPLYLKLRKRARRLMEWARVGALAGRRIKITTLWRYWYGPRVPDAIWRERLRTCSQCVIYDRSLHRCNAETPIGEVGCGCWCPAVAKMPAPYASEKGRGCWGRATMGEGFGWGEFHSENGTQNTPKLFS